MQIDRLTEEDWSRLQAVRLSALATDPEAFGTTHAMCVTYDEARWREQLRTLTTFVAVVEGGDVGMLRCVSDPEAPNAVWLRSMWVAPNARRRGVASALIDTVVAWARARNATEVRLDVRVRNRAGITLYEGKGFSPVGDPVPEPPPLQHIVEQRYVLPMT